MGSSEQVPSAIYIYVLFFQSIDKYYFSFYYFSGKKGMKVSRFFYHLNGDSLFYYTAHAMVMKEKEKIIIIIFFFF